MKHYALLFLTLFVALAAGCGARETTPPTAVPPPPTNNAAQPMNTPVPPPAPAPAATAETSGDACAAGESNRESPLYDHQVYLTTSPDGAQFAGPGELILEHASVPDGVIGPDGRLSACQPENVTNITPLRCNSEHPPVCENSYNLSVKRRKKVL